MAITLSGLTLPNALRWAEEFSSRLIQETQESRGGVVHLFQGARSGWEPMTLTGIAESAGMSRSDLSALAALLETGVPLTLTLHDNSTHTVRPRVESGRVVEWEPILPIHDPSSADVVRILNIHFWRAI